MLKYRNLQQPADLEHAFHAFHDSVEDELAPALQRFRTVKEWIRFTDINPERSLEAYQPSIALLPRIVTLDLDLHSRHAILLSGTDGVAEWRICRY